MSKDINVCLDSRLVKEGDYFVPIKGDNFDGHDFIEEAKERGAAGIIEEDELYEKAKEKLDKVNPTVIAITGSVGKTTTTGYITQILSTQFKVCKGYLNTKLGHAKTIINDLNNGDEFYVAECGMDRKGELLETGNYLKPDVVVLTNISETHLEKLGILENIKEAKAELLQTLKKEGVAFFNWSNKNVRDVAKKYAPDEYYRYGLEENYKTNPDFINNVSVLGKHNLQNAHGAYKIADYLGVKNVSKKLSNLKSSKGRMNILQGVNGSVIVDDTYNSSPESAKYALESVQSYSKKKGINRKIAVLGGMLELGDYEEEGHTKVGSFVADYNYDFLVLVGGLAKKFTKSKKLKNSKTKICFVDESTEVPNVLLNEVKIEKGDIILFKASQGVRLEKAVKKIMKYPNKASKKLVRQDPRWLS